MIPTDRAWAAGYIDGEGCLDVPRGIRVRVTNTHKPTLDHLQSFFGGSVRPHSARTPQRAHRPTWVWTVHGMEASDALEKLLPFLREKEKQARCLLQYHTIAGIRTELADQARASIRRSLRMLKRVES